MSLAHNKIPDRLCELAKQLAKPAMPVDVEFLPEAAIVNYFGLGIIKMVFYYIYVFIIIFRILF